MSIDIKLKHSSVLDKAPTAGDLAEGELALNINAGSPAAYIKDSGGSIVKLAGVGAVGSYWDRTGTTLSPATAGDDVNIGSGKVLLKADGTVDASGLVISRNGSDFGYLRSDAIVWAGTAPSSFSINHTLRGGIAHFNDNGIVAIGTDKANPKIELNGDNGEITCNSGLADTFSVDSHGTTKIGGTLPATPNIALNADGSATFAGDIQSTSQNGGPLAGFRNQIINGGMAIWQRGTSGSGVGYNGPDRWRSASTNPGVTRRTVSVAASRAGVPTTYSCGVTGGGGAGGIIQCIEFPYGPGRQSGYDVGNTYTFSWYANTTSTSNISSYTPYFQDDSAGTNGVIAGTQTSVELIETLGSSGWGRFKTVITITGNVASTNLGLRIGVSSINGSEIEFTGLQFEPGPVATPFEHRPIGTELALCQRYFLFLNNSNVRFPVTQNANTTELIFIVPTPVTMRATPTVTGTCSKVGVSTGSSYGTGACTANATSFNATGIVRLFGTGFTATTDSAIGRINGNLDAEL